MVLAMCRMVEGWVAVGSEDVDVFTATAFTLVEEMVVRIKSRESRRHDFTIFFIINCFAREIGS